jgi:hypothetical protein
MSATDGNVLGVTKIVNNGPDTERWNLVIIGDGYQQRELAKYRDHAKKFVDRLQSTAPFDEMFNGINVHRIDVVSDESGADDPGCAGGPAVTRKTYFDATFCSPHNGRLIDRLLTVDNALALSVAKSHVSQNHHVVCIVNSTKYGGSGGSIAVCSVHALARKIAIHELGHSAFGLADEYGGNGLDTPAGEPPTPNVTRDTNPATNKWGALVAVGTPMPTQCNPGCVGSGCVAPGAPPVPGVVGTYEGALWSDCGIYRPMEACYMSSYDPFCPVCAGVIKETLQAFMP